MSKVQKHTAIFYIKKQQGVFYADESAAPVTIEFPKEAVYNLELKNKELLDESLKSHLDHKDIKPSNIILLLDPEVTFDKDLIDIPVSLQTAEAEKFLDMVPLEGMISSRFHLNNKTKVVAAPQSLCREIMRVFLQLSFRVTATVPLSVMSELLPECHDGFAKKPIFKNIVLLRQYNLFRPPENQGKVITNTKPKFSGLQFLLLFGTFIILLLILITLIFTHLL